MLAVEFIEFAIIRRVMLGAVPPVPVTTLCDEKFFEG